MTNYELELLYENGDIFRDKIDNIDSIDVSGGNIDFIKSSRNFTKLNTIVSNSSDGDFLNQENTISTSYSHIELIDSIIHYRYIEKDQSYIGEIDIKDIIGIGFNIQIENLRDTSLGIITIVTKKKPYTIHN